MLEIKKVIYKNNDETKEEEYDASVYYSEREGLCADR
jgi:hypothetical protein